jgi:hypothetical protein
MSPFCALAGPLPTTTSHTYPHTIPPTSTMCPARSRRSVRSAAKPAGQPGASCASRRPIGSMANSRSPVTGRRPPGRACPTRRSRPRRPPPVDWEDATGSVRGPLCGLCSVASTKGRKARAHVETHALRGALGHSTQPVVVTGHPRSLTLGPPGAMHGGPGRCTGRLHHTKVSDHRLPYMARLK